jgi:bacteriorhodopsin
MVLNRYEENQTIIDFVSHLLYLFISLPLLIGSLKLLLFRKWGTIPIMLGAVLNIILLIHTAIFTRMLLSWGIIMLIFFSLIFGLTYIFHRKEKKVEDDSSQLQGGFLR